jgi:tRNA/tmRNA/rRNA uracil-C5-methylase (TrmA/RlmC/RlmD family)
VDVYCSQMTRLDCVKAITRWQAALDWWSANRPDHVYAVESLTEAIEAAKRRIAIIEVEDLTRLARKRDATPSEPTNPPRPWPYTAPTPARNEGIVF